MFSADQVVKGFKQNQRRLLPIIWRQDSFKLLDSKPKSVGGDASLIGKLIGNPQFISCGLSLPRETPDASPNAHDFIYDGFLRTVKNTDRRNALAHLFAAWRVPEHNADVITQEITSLLTSRSLKNGMWSYGANSQLRLSQPASRISRCDLKSRTPAG